MILLELILGISTAALAAAKYICRYRIAHIRRQQDHLHVFYSAAGRIIDDPETPVILVDLILALSSNILSKSLTPKIAWEGLRGHFWEPDNSKSVLREKILRTTTCLPVRLRKDWSDARSAFILAVTYNSVISGTFVRRLMLISLRDNRLPNDENSSHNYDPQNLDPIIADIAARHEKVIAAAA